MVTNRRSGPRLVVAMLLTMVAGLVAANGVSAAPCVPPEVDISQYVVGGQVDLEAYLAAVAAANAICEGSDSGGVVLEPGQAPPVTEVIGAQGGSIVVTAANGVVFTLTVPEGALSEPVDITMRAVTLTTGSVTSYAAVHFTPEGLRFNPAAQLSISFTNGMPDRISLYRYEGVGADLSQISYSNLDTDTITTSVPHFSGVAVFATESVAPAGSPPLPSTGSDAAALVPIGVVVAALGVVAVATSRRRRERGV